MSRAAVLFTALLLLATPAIAQVAPATDTLRAEPVPPQLRVIFDRCDTNADGQLSWQEFETCWRQLRYGNRRTVQPPEAPIIDVPANPPRVQPLPGTDPATPVR